MTLSSRMIATSCGAMMVAIAGCGVDPADVQAMATTVADGQAEHPRSHCTEPAPPLHGTVVVAVTLLASTATYRCAEDFNLIGDAVRVCQPNSAWSGSTPTCVFAQAGVSCGGCGGSYDDDGVCSVATPANLGAPCDVGPGVGACAGGGTIVCGGACQANDPTIGDATAWHVYPTSLGSWDWDCDGAVTTSFHPSSVPPDCASLGDAESCEAAVAIEYMAEDAPCGHQATLFMRDCGWKTLGPTCLNTPAGHRVVFQQCR